MGELRVESGGVGEWLELLLIAQLGRPLNVLNTMFVCPKNVVAAAVIRPRNVIEAD